MRQLGKSWEPGGGLVVVGTTALEPNNEWSASHTPIPVGCYGCNPEIANCAEMTEESACSASKLNGIKDALVVVSVFFQPCL